MGMTMTQKILAAHAGLEKVEAGQLIRAKLDIVLGNDITTPVAVREFEKAGFDRVFDPDRVVIVLDHFVPNKDIKAAQQSKTCREFACAHCVSHFYDVGKMGIEHALLPEQGIVTAGDCIIGADSHTCTYGALGAFSTGVGSTDMAAGMATGNAWFKVPSAIRFNLTGQLAPNCSGKDVILTIIGMIGVDGALYKSMEFTGSGIRTLSMDDRLCICNMAIEAGAKNGSFPVDAVTMAYLEEKGIRDYKIYTTDPDFQYAEELTCDVSGLKPQVSAPSSVDNVYDLDKYAGTKIDEAYLGSCTGGRVPDIAVAARILKGKHIPRDTRMIVVPASKKVMEEAMDKGYIKTLMEAGACITAPGCAACLGVHQGMLTDGETCISSTNRNFPGRMGSTDAGIFLASPAAVAASALNGCITDPTPYLKD